MYWGQDLLRVRVYGPWNNRNGMEIRKLVFAGYIEGQAFTLV